MISTDNLEHFQIELSAVNNWHLYELASDFSAATSTIVVDGSEFSLSHVHSADEHPGASHTAAATVAFCHIEQHSRSALALWRRCPLSKEMDQKSAISTIRERSLSQIGPARSVFYRPFLIVYTQTNNQVCFHSFSMQTLFISEIKLYHYGLLAFIRTKIF